MILSKIWFQDAPCQWWPAHSADNKILFFFLKDHFIVGQSWVAAGTPIHNTRATINKTVFVHARKYFRNGRWKAFIQSVTFSRPVTAWTHLPYLGADFRSWFFHKKNARALKLLPSHAAGWDLPRQAFSPCSGWQYRHDRFREATMLGHHSSFEANHNIFNGKHRSMTKMQNAGGIRRRHDNCKRFLPLMIFGVKSPIFPYFVNTILVFLCFISFFNFCGHVARILNYEFCNVYNMLLFSM